jgi:hypothetical protein
MEKFCSETLPKWQRRFRVENSAKNMPQFVEAEARLELYLEAQGNALWLQPGIVYGDPPIARIRDGVFRPTGPEVPIRNPDRERRLKDDLWRQWGMELYQSHLYAAPEAIRMVEHFKNWDGAVSGDGFHQFRKVGRLKADVNWTNGQLHLDMELEDQPGKSKIDGTAALKAWERGDSLVPLLDGGFAELPHDWLACFGKKVLDLILAQNDKDELPRAALPGLIQLFEEQGKASPPDLEAFRRLRHFDFHKADARLPTNFQAELRGYQMQGVAFLQHLQHLELGAL